MQPTAADFDRVLENESHRFREVLEAAAPDRSVPTCDPWSAADLLWHLTEVQGFWAEIVAGGHADPESVHRITRPSGYDGILESFDAAHQALRAALADADDPDPAWTWAEDQTVGFIRRRQAHEALIHRVDAELTAGTEVRPVAPHIAADGIDELLTVMVDGVPPWGRFEPEEETISIACTDLPRVWRLRFRPVPGHLAGLRQHLRSRHRRTRGRRSDDELHPPRPRLGPRPLALGPGRIDHARGGGSQRARFSAAFDHQRDNPVGTAADGSSGRQTCNTRPILMRS
jgi:uncharacterized protein (TIGR03083 family)